MSSFTEYLQIIYTNQRTHADDSFNDEEKGKAKQKSIQKDKSVHRSRKPSQEENELRILDIDKKDWTSASSAFPALHEGLLIDSMRDLPIASNDYTCGVQTSRWASCRRKFSCSIHKEKEKILVKRSKPLSFLRELEKNNKDAFTNRRRIVKRWLLTQTSKDDLTSLLQPALYRGPMALKSGRFRHLPVHVPSPTLTLSVSNIVATKDVFCHLMKNHRPLLPSHFPHPAEPLQLTKKQLYVRNLSRSASIMFDEVISYLHYKLQTISKMSERERVENFRNIKQ